jgi:YfiH family protein
MEWRERDGVRWLEAELDRGRAAFSTRLGGVSQEPFDSLNLGLFTGDRRDDVLANRHRLAVALEIDPRRVLSGLQVHGAAVATHASAPARSGYADPVPNPEEVDGHATAQVGLAPLVLVADCLPVALAGPGGVAMLHCGWRGVAAGIVAKGVDAVQASTAAVGPGIGACCYEVGPEVVEALGELAEGFAAPSASGAEENGTRSMLDLPGVAERALTGAGVEQVELSGLCTSCEPGLFFSHRRDGGQSGRQAGVAWLAG